MSWGGKRAGSGRKKGIGNAKSIVDRAYACKVAADTGISPLAFILGVAADPDLPLSTRLNAATAALPYCYPRYGTVPGPTALLHAPDGKLLEGVSVPVAQGITTINIMPIESGSYLDSNSIAPIEIPSIDVGE
jgi:hypothetical protein